MRLRGGQQIVSIAMESYPYICKICEMFKCNFSVKLSNASDIHHIILMYLVRYIMVSNFRPSFNAINSDTFKVKICITLMFIYSVIIYD